MWIMAYTHKSVRHDANHLRICLLINTGYRRIVRFARLYSHCSTYDSWIWYSYGRRILWWIVNVNPELILWQPCDLQEVHGVVEIQIDNAIPCHRYTVCTDTGIRWSFSDQYGLSGSQVEMGAVACCGYGKILHPWYMVRWIGVFHKSEDHGIHPISKRRKRNPDVAT